MYNTNKSCLHHPI